MSFFGNIGVVTGFAILLGASVASAVPNLPDKLTHAYVEYVMSVDEVVTKHAYEGYGETCVLESWSYPAKYTGIRQYKVFEGENAKPTIVTPKPNDAECSDNFNKHNPAKPISGNDYGPDYGQRAIEFLEGELA